MSFDPTYRPTGVNNLSNPYYRRTNHTRIARKDETRGVFTESGGGGGNDFMATIANFGVADGIVFDSGAAFGRDSAVIPFSVPITNAPNGTELEARTILRSDGLTVVEDWKVVGTATSGAAACNFVCTQAAGLSDWLLLEVRVVGSSQTPTRMTAYFDLGHVVGIMGQSELDRLFIRTGSFGGYEGPWPEAEQYPVIRGDATYGGSGVPGNPVTGFTITKGFIAPGSGLCIRLQNYADTFTKNGLQRKMMTIDLTQSGHGRFELADDTLPNRRWTDFTDCLDAAGWQDGVRPGAIIDMWTNADVVYASDFITAYKPFYTGLLADGSNYVLGADISVETFPGTPGTDDVNVRFDHILFDLTGNDNGLFNPTETRLFLCHHRYDPFNADQVNALGLNNFDVVTEMWGQEMIQQQFDLMLQDADFIQVMEYGTEPMNYENGTETGGGLSWGDQIHPGDGLDGLSLFARHVAHATMKAFGLVTPTVPLLDTVVFDPAGAYADFSWSGGDITTTRIQRSNAMPSPAPGDHWANVFGFEFNGVPVEQADIVDNAGAVANAGKIRVYVPPGAGSGAGGAADWSRDRFFFARGGGSGVLLPISDPLEQAWQNYPVVDSTDLLIQGMYDDQTQTAGGIALRRSDIEPHTILAHDTYRDACLRMEGTHFEDPNGIQTANGGVSATQLHMELEVATYSTQEVIYLCGLEDDVDLFISRSLELRTAVWAGGGGTTAANFMPVPGVRYRYKLIVDITAKTLKVYVNDTLIINDALGGSASNFINAANINFLGFDDSGGSQNVRTPLADFTDFRVWIDSNTVDDSTPLTAPYFSLSASDGLAAVQTSPWRRSGGTITQYSHPDQPGLPSTQPGTPIITDPIPPDALPIDSEADMRNFITAAAADPSVADGAVLAVGANVDLRGITGQDWSDAFVYSDLRTPTIVRSVDPDNPGRMFEVNLRMSNVNDDTVTGNVWFKDIRFDATSIPLQPPEWGNATNAATDMITSLHSVRNVLFEGCLFIGPYNEARVDNRDAERRSIGIDFRHATDLTINMCRFERMNTGFVLGGTNMLLQDLVYRHMWEDAGRFSPGRVGAIAVDTSNITIRRLLYYDGWGRNQLHADGLMQVDNYFNGSGSADLTDFLIEGCVYFPGDQIFQPANGNGYGSLSALLWDTLPAQIPGDHYVMNRFRVGGTVELPPTVTAPLDGQGQPQEQNRRFAVQIEGSVDPTPSLTIVPPSGMTMVREGDLATPIGSYTLSRKAETIECKIDQDDPTRYIISTKRGASNWFQSNFNDNGWIRRWTFRDCIVWGTTPNGVSMQANAEDVILTRMSFLRPLPGDVSGDGVANDWHDGGDQTSNHPRILKRGAPETMTTTFCVASVNFNQDGADTNNFAMSYNDTTDLVANYPVTPSGDGYRHYPTTPSEAATLARPLPGSPIAVAGIGACGVTPATDTFDWSWLNEVS